MQMKFRLALAIAAILEIAGAQPKPNLPKRTILPRQDVSKLNTDDPNIQALRTAIAKMQQITREDPTDCRGWRYQAAIHGDVDQPTGKPVPWNQCQHGTYYFLPWHRMYVYYFEQLVQRLSGYANFRMPYWNSTAAGGAAIPAYFRVPAGGAADALQVARERQLVPDLTLQLAQAFGAMDFYNDNTPTTGCVSFGGHSGEAMHGGARSASGSLEDGPHRTVHQTLGAKMAFPYTAAQDPIFFLHHSNIDRLWESWIRKGYGANPTNGEWLDHSFTFCEAPADGSAGMPVTATVREFLKLTDLGYRYDRLERPKLASPAPACAGTKLTSLAEGTPGGPITDPLTAIQLRLTAAPADAAPRGSKPTLRLLLRDMTWQSKVDARFEVSIGPADPNTKDAPVLVGDSHFYFFADPQHEAHAGEHSEEFALPGRVWTWATRSKSAEPLTVYLKRMPLAPDAADLFDAASQPRIGSVQLLVRR